MLSFGSMKAFSLELKQNSSKKFNPPTILGHLQKRVEVINAMQKYYKKFVRDFRPVLTVSLRGSLEKNS